MGLLRLDPAWKKQKLMMHDYSYITNFVSLLRAYNMLKRSNQGWVIYPKKNFKSNKNKQLSKYFIRQRHDINKIAQVRFTKQDYIIFHQFGLEFSANLMFKLQIQPADRVILYLNQKQHRIGFRFYLNRSYRQHKKSDLHSKDVLDAIKLNPGLFRNNRIDIDFGYLIFDWNGTQMIKIHDPKYVIQIAQMIRQNYWIVLDKHYQLQFDYIHNRWEVRL